MSEVSQTPEQVAPIVKPRDPNVKLKASIDPQIQSLVNDRLQRTEDMLNTTGLTITRSNDFLPATDTAIAKANQDSRDDVARDLRAQRKIRDAEKLSRIDPLTEVLNKTAITEELERTIEIANRDETGTFGVEVEMFDLDKFGKVNSDFDQITGDRLLKGVVGVVNSQPATRKTDIVGRFGGEEFLIIKPYHNLNPEDSRETRSRYITTQLNTPESPRDRTRHALENTDFSQKKGLEHFVDAETTSEGQEVVTGRKQTASTGIARYERGESADSLQFRANIATQIAKLRGRNRTIESRRDNQGNWVYFDITNNIPYSAEVDYDKRKLIGITDMSKLMTWNVVENGEGKSSLVPR